MPPEFTSTAIRPVGEIRDAIGRSLAVGSDCDAVVIAVPGIGIVYLDAERMAEQWAREHGASDV